MHTHAHTISANQGKVQINPPIFCIHMKIYNSGKREGMVQGDIKTFSVVSSHGACSLFRVLNSFFDKLICKGLPHN